MQFKGKEYAVEVNKIDPPMLYGRISLSNVLVAEVFWRYMDQDNDHKKCDLPGIKFVMPAAKQCGLTSDNWNIRDRRNTLHAHVYNEVCGAVGLPKIDLGAKEKELVQQAPKAYKKSASVQQSQQTTQTVQQAPQVQAAPVQDTKIQQLLNSRVQLRGNQQQVAQAPKTATIPSVEIFTDGACSGNPGPGGWGVILRMGNHEKELNGGELSTTNNCMELRAGIEALKALKKPCNVTLTSDSKYLVKGATEWLNSWLEKGWKNSKGDPVANQELWEELIPLLKTHNVQFKWVKGHNGHPENERCDELARKAIDQLRQQATMQEEVYPDDVDYLPEDDFYEE